MLTKYVQEAMSRAEYEIMEDGNFWAEIPGFEGLWGNGSNLEECRQDLQGALEGWLILKLWDHDDDIPKLGRLSVYPRRNIKARLNETALTSRTRKAV
jgi:predicted RNase H-like HicB family nuclease